MGYNDLSLLQLEDITMKTFYGTIWGRKTRIRVNISEGVATDDFGKQYTTRKKSCGLPGCKCDLWLVPVTKASLKKLHEQAAAEAATSN